MEWLRNICKQREEELIALRRALHRVPEIGLRLPRTKAIVYAKLDQLGIPYRENEGDDGVIAEIRGAKAGKTIAFRADMDALHIQEVERPYASEIPGQMHGCGHDAHTAMLLMAAAILNEHKDRYEIHAGDFVMGKIGTIGKPFRLPLPQEYTLSANVILIQPNPDIIIPDFLFWQFASPLITRQLTLGATATSQPAFGIKKARKLQIRICDIEKQKSILSDISEKMSVCDSIEKTVDTALQQAEAMRQSILKKAFEGRI